MQGDTKGALNQAVVLALFIIAAIAFGAWRVMHTNSHQQITPVSTQSVNDTNYLTVKEFGIKVPIDTSTKGLTYVFKDNEAIIRSDLLNSAKDATCNDLNDNAVVLARGYADTLFPMQNFGDRVVPNGYTFKRIYDEKLPPVNTKLGGYYYFGYVEGSCSLEGESFSESNAQDAIVKALQRMVPE